MKVYLLSTHDEHGSEDVRATLDPAKLPAMLRMYRPDRISEEDYLKMEARMNELLSAREELWTSGEYVDPDRGWGGIMLHIIELQ